jgi:hypothetical protein
LAARNAEEAFSEKALRKAKRAFAKAERNVDVASIKVLAICLGAAIAFRIALWAANHAIDTLMDSLQQFFAPINVAYGLEVYVPALENPYSAANTNQAFGFTGILVLTCFFAVLMVAQKSAEEKSRARLRRSSPRKKIHSLIHSPGKSITSASFYHPTSPRHY